jgi:hypothetical protein
VVRVVELGLRRARVGAARLSAAGGSRLAVSTLLRASAIAGHGRGSR